MSSTPFQCLENGAYELQCQDVHPHYRYSEASAAWTLICAMIIFFMRAGFMMIELSFSSEVPERRNIVFLYQHPRKSYQLSDVQSQRLRMRYRNAENTLSLQLHLIRSPPISVAVLLANPNSKISNNKPYNVIDRVDINLEHNNFG